MFLGKFHVKYSQQLGKDLSGDREPKDVLVH